MGREEEETPISYFYSHGFSTLLPLLSASRVATHRTRTIAFHTGVSIYYSHIKDDKAEEQKG